MVDVGMTSKSILFQSSSQTVVEVSSAVKQRFPARTRLPLQPDAIWLIQTGVVRSVTWLENGVVVSSGIWGSGDIVGLRLSVSNPYELECLTLVEATLLPVGQGQLDTNLLLAHIHRLEELVTIRSYRPVETMMVKFLGWLAKQFGEAVHEGQLIDLRLTHQDIAEILGTTRVTVTRVLGQLEQQGIIHRLAMQKILLKQEEVWHYQI